MNIAVARRELRDARVKGFCGFCFARGEPGRVLAHAPGCKGVRDACLPRKRPTP